MPTQLSSNHPSDATELPKQKPLTVAVLGNPNTGKSTLFNALSGIHQKVGNYPGVTVEKRLGTVTINESTLTLVDLPGTYSLAPRTADEMLSVDVLLGNQSGVNEPDLLLCVVDATNLERNLFLTSQLLDLKKPLVVALNMVDVATKHGVTIDHQRLSDQLGVPVVPIRANRREGIDALKEVIFQQINNVTPPKEIRLSDDLESRLNRLGNSYSGNEKTQRFILTRMLFDTNGFMTERFKDKFDQDFLNAVKQEQKELGNAGEFAEVESHSRYDWIYKHAPDFITTSQAKKKTLADHVDRLLTHPILGLIIAAVSMVFLFQIVFWAAEPASMIIDWLTGIATGLVDQLFISTTGNAEGTLHSLLVDGLIAGVGGVLIFLPQIMLLFFILAILEDSGYLARLAFLTDKYLSKVGLSGITLIPLLSSFACAIPGIMGTRVIKNERERLITILIAPLMSCSARLPVYALLIAAFVPSTTYYGLGLQGLTLLAMYLVGIIVAIGVAWVLKKTMLKEGSSTFVMELPSYKLPSLGNVWFKVYQGGASFVKDAGTIIVAATILVWAAAYFPRNVESLPDGLLDREAALTASLENVTEGSPEAETLEEELVAVSNQIDAHFLQTSYLGRTGKAIEPLVEPLGWDWRIGSAAIASFPAREVIVSTMGVLFGLGGEVDEESASMRSSLQNATWDGSERKLFNIPVVLSIMVFFALCAQCSSTLAVIKRETNSWVWPTFTFVYMT
ncbi:MAG: ferrous iron transport protein B, partial [Pirellulaceae bacterium]|nr:ferrous iron transport protein B [Pirellulaceae bacterium]